MEQRKPEKKTSEPAPQKAAAPAPAKQATVRGRVWPHGSISFSGTVFRAGEACELPAEIAAQLGEVFIPDEQ